MLIARASHDVFGMIRNIIIIIVLYIQLFMYCYTGDKLSSQNEKLQIAIWNTPWYTISPNIVKDMILIMMRSNKKFDLTAGKIYIINLESYTQLIKSMASYFTVLRLMFVENI